MLKDNETVVAKKSSDDKTGKITKADILMDIGADGRKIHRSALIPHSSQKYIKDYFGKSKTKQIFDKILI